MSTNQTRFVGIDISKDTFDVYYQDAEDQAVHLKLANHSAGFQALQTALTVYDSVWVVMEASGPYYYPLACYLHEQDIHLSVVNPLVIRRFCQMRLQRAKTDRADAQSIYQYALLMQPQAWQPLEEKYLQIKQCYTVQSQLLKHQHAIAQQQQAYTVMGQDYETLTLILDKERQHLADQIQALQDEIDTLIEQQAPDLKERLESIPGIGNKTSTLLIVALRGFESFTHHKQVVSYLGLAPRIYQSGTSVHGKAKICKMGMGEVRACLYMAARSARKYNPTCKALYDRLRAKGKAHKLAMIAVVNKLLKQAFAIAKSGQNFDVNYAGAIPVS